MAQKAEISIEAGAVTNTKTNPPSPKSRLAMLKRTKKTSNASSDPFRFQNNGVSYKGKLIGEQDVDKPRGDLMCSDAMRNAKGMIKAAGAHKTRITLQINIEGIKILDEKSGAVLHNFPVSRISFIARDSADARAFGLIYGEPAGKGKYKFYGIKTAQSADQAVLAIRDMFQVVFEMKKKHIDFVKQQQSDGNVSSPSKEGGVAVADLLDLESELQQIEQGVQQLSTVPTNTDAFGATPFGDPFADSFNTTNNSNAAMNASNMSNNSGYSAHSASNAFSPFGNSPVQQQQPQQPQQQNAFVQPQQAWPQTSVIQHPSAFGNGWGAAPSFPSVAPMHHAHSTPAFNTNGFSETNPFATAAFGGQPVAAAPAPLLMAAPVRDPFSLAPQVPQSQPSAFNSMGGAVDWNGAAMPMTKENLAPQLHHASTFANFGDNKVNTNMWEEKRLTSLEEAFTKLVDMDALIGNGGVGNGAGNETKKNPFEHILNPPKASLNSLSTSCSAAQMAAQQKPGVVASADPFGDDPFFR